MRGWVIQIIYLAVSKSRVRGGANGGVKEGGRGEEQDIGPARQGWADIIRIKDSDYARPTNGSHSSTNTTHAGDESFLRMLLPGIALVH